MDNDFIVNMVISQVGEEKAKEVLNMLLGLADKMSSDKIYVIKKLGAKGVCLISTNDGDCKIDFRDGAKPVVTEIEKSLRDIEI